MRKLKIAVIGAGSSYTPELIEGFIARADKLNVGSFSFMDIDLNKAGIIAALAERMLRGRGVPSGIILTDNLNEAVSGSDYVLGQIRVGGLDARVLDEKIPPRYDLIGQETTGAGGFMKALRTVPEVLKIAKSIENHAKDAWYINFTNPAGIVTQALQHTAVKNIGLCNGPINMIRNVKKMLPSDTRSFDYDFAGLNHLCFITAVYADWVDILHKLIDSGLNSAEFKNITAKDFPAELLKAIGGIPAAYLNYYLNRDEQLKICRDAEKTRGEICREVEADLFKLYRDTSLCEKPRELSERGGALYSEAAVSIIDAIENDKNEVHVVNVKNRNAYPFMDYDDVVEVKCVINKNGAAPICLKDFNNDYIIGLMRAVKAFERLTVKAAMTGCYETALLALLAHPLVQDYTRAKGVLDEMLEANRAFLPAGAFL